MKKMFLILFIIFLSTLIYGCVQEAVKEPIVAENGDTTQKLPPTEATPVVKEVVEEVVPVEPVVEKTEQFEMFEPVLTYDGAYNGPLYGTSEQVGSASMDNYFKTLDRNGINFFIGMFGISGEPQVDTLISDKGLGEVIDAAQKHPHRIIPFFNPGIGGEDVEQYLGDTLLGWYKETLAASKNIAGNDFIRGFGEIETQEWTARHNDPRVMELISIAKKNKINFMFHPVASKIDDVEKMVEAYPDTIFLIHMFREDLDKSMSRLITIMKEHDNLYFSMDAAHIIHINNNDIIYQYDGTNKQLSISQFVSAFDSKEKSVMNAAISAYKPLVDAVPDKVMWGTEIGPEYAFEPEVFDRAVKISRFVIAGFDKEHQEAVGYKNALRVFGQGVVADAGIKVLNTRSWFECTDAQMSDCDTFCETPDTDVLTAEDEACFQNCVVGKRCREVVEMDTG